MYNELLFFFHLLLVVGFVLIAFRLGKEALTVWIALQAVLANFFVLKQMLLFGYNVTCSDVFAIGSIASLNLLQEHFGKESARKAIWISFFAMVFFAVMSQVHLYYLPSPSDHAHPSFASLLTAAPRLLLASLFSFFMIQQLDLHLFSLLKRLFPKSRLGSRGAISLIITQFLDTLLFTFLGLYGLGFAVGDILLVSFLLKLLIIALTLPLNFFVRKIAHEV
jgi:uncharacterized integral membrane protein (TIGR00697 family)